MHVADSGNRNSLSIDRRRGIACGTQDKTRTSAIEIQRGDDRQGPGDIGQWIVPEDDRPDEGDVRQGSEIDRFDRDWPTLPFHRLAEELRESCPENHHRQSRNDLVRSQRNDECAMHERHHHTNEDWRKHRQPDVAEPHAELERRHGPHQQVTLDAKIDDARALGEHCTQRRQDERGGDADGVGKRDQPDVRVHAAPRAGDPAMRRIRNRFLRNISPPSANNNTAP